MNDANTPSIWERFKTALFKNTNNPPMTTWNSPVYNPDVFRDYTLQNRHFQAQTDSFVNTETKRNMELLNKKFNDIIVDIGQMPIDLLKKLRGD